jgi:predicted enzyme related to lactoylglutathione lyase
MAGFAAPYITGWLLDLTGSSRAGLGGGQAMPDGTLPTPGGWNRFSLEVADVAGTADRLREAGVHLHSDLITGVCGNQVVIDDPSGNPVELFEPTRAEAHLIPRH